MKGALLQDEDCGVTIAVFRPYRSVAVSSSLLKLCWDRVHSTVEFPTYRPTGWSKKWYPSYILAITSVNVHRF